MLVSAATTSERGHLMILAAVIAAAVVAELAVLADVRNDRRALDFIRDPASITEREATYRNELSRHVDEAGL
jgi:hypothetical protein